jgi:hypothetical protein
MGSEYEESRHNLEQLVSWYGSRAGSRNEATTRLQLIDRLFFECLAWSRDQVILEEPHGREYADYTFVIFRPVLIVEAKREGDYFELPAGVNRLEHSLPSLMRDYPNLKQAIEQAARYCQSRGVPFGAVTNGHQVVAFVAVRNDGTAPLDGRALVFSSLDVMLTHFLHLWQALSRPGVDEKKILYRLIGGHPELPQKLSSTISSYPGIKGRNVLQTDLQILSELVIEDVIRSEELEPRFLAECYCQSGALSQFALTSKAVLAARYAALFDSSQPGPTTVPATTKAGVSPDLLAASLARRPILLLGDVGVGKTTFIRHLIKVEAAALFENAIALHIDLGLKATLSVDLRAFILVEMERQLLELYKIDIYERNFVRGIYDRDLKRFASGVFADLRQSAPEQFAQKEVEFLATLLSQKDRHLRRSLEHVYRGRRKQIVVFLDNADQRDERTQDLAFLIAQELAEDWPMMVFLALRPETFHRSKKIGALTGYHAKAFTIAPPRIDVVIRKRLVFALKITSGEIPVPMLERIGLKLERLPIIIRVLLQSFDDNERLMESIENVASGNVRMALDLIKAFIGSGHVDTQKILDCVAEHGGYRIPLHEFLRSVMYGDSEYYDPSTSPICNLFDVSTLDGKEHFLLPLTIGILRDSTGPDVKDGFVETGKVYERLQGMGFTPDQIDSAIARGYEKNLIETSARRLPEPGPRMPPSLRATPTGVYHIERLAGEFQYLDAVVVDTPILDGPVRALIGDVKTFNQRLDRAEIFARYLDRQWLNVGTVALGFNWRTASGAFDRQAVGIRRSQMGG